MLDKFILIFLLNFMQSSDCRNCSSPRLDSGTLADTLGRPLNKASAYEPGSHVMLTCPLQRQPINGYNQSVCGYDGLWYPPLGVCSDSAEEICGLQGTSDRIVGGLLAQRSELPWMARLSIRNSNHPTGVTSICGGTLLNNEWILTAAHCLYTNGTVLRVEVTLGREDFSSIGDRSRQQFQLASHYLNYEKYNRRTQLNDFALLKLSAPVTFTASVRPVCLPDRFCNLATVPTSSSIYDSCNSDTDRVVTAGWGRQDPDITRTSNTLMKLNMTLFARSRCSTRDAALICARGKQVQTDSCMGDSGGPLLCYKEGRAYQIGIVSYGTPDCGEIPSYYARVCSALSWIRSVITGSSNARLVRL